jgi:hypothetical protein
MLLDFTNRAQLAAFDEQCIQYGKRLSIMTQDCPALRLLYDQFTATGIVETELSRRIALALERKMGRECFS